MKERLSSSSSTPTDILTKSLGRLRFSEMKKMIGMVTIETKEQQQN
jgi:hypothetical protein